MIKTAADAVPITFERLNELFKNQTTTAQLKMWRARKHFDATRPKDSGRYLIFTPDQLLRLTILVHLRRRGFRGKLARQVGLKLCELLAEGDRVEAEDGQLATTLLILTPDTVKAHLYCGADPAELRRAVEMAEAATGGELFDITAMRAHVLAGFGPSQQAKVEDFRDLEEYRTVA